METTKFESRSLTRLALISIISTMVLASFGAEAQEKEDDPYLGPDFEEVDPGDIVDEHGPLPGNDVNRERQKTNIMRVLQLVADQIRYFMSTEDIEIDTEGEIKNVGKVDIAITDDEILTLYFRKYEGKYYFSFAAGVLTDSDFSESNPDIYSQDAAREDVVHVHERNGD